MSDACSVPSVARAIRILELLANSRRGLTLSDVSRKLALPKSSTHVLLRTLEVMGYLKSSKHSGRYSFGLKLISLSNLAVENLDLREQAKPFLRELMLATELTVHLAVLEGTEAVIIDKVEPPGMLRLATWVGRRMDANSSGVGKALLAFLPPETSQEQLIKRRLPKYNSNTISNPARLARELQKIRNQGYAFEDEEGEIGFRCVGVPIFDAENRVVAAISIAGTTAQIPHENVARLASKVQTSAMQISTQLGYGSTAA